LPFALETSSYQLTSLLVHAQLVENDPLVEVVFLFQDGDGVLKLIIVDLMVLLLVLKFSEKIFCFIKQ
jgi:hypothetical protein